MHAAALGGASMRDVQTWAADPDRYAGQIQAALRRSPEPAFEVDVLQFLQTNDRTRTSISTTIMPALAWLHDHTAARAAGQQTGREPIIDATGVTLPEPSANCRRGRPASTSKRCSPRTAPCTCSARKTRRSRRW